MVMQLVRGTKDNGKQIAEVEGSKSSGPLEAENIEDDSVQPMVRPRGSLLEELRIPDRPCLDFNKDLGLKYGTRCKWQGHRSQMAGSKGQDANLECFKCGLRRHYAWECPKKKNGSLLSNTAKGKNHICWNQTTKSYSKRNRHDRISMLYQSLY
ncbi:hypothetical protein M9H77_16116 [Catharanthus roseus]|uniref:Uncharacterized protein n=1 Tax=Catharanthus roseus TaxID=4058 RepID=A0ACC0B188_CATRO|nr:hypothetical protein M9H77_16116 [Catharanthus roseus]